MNNQNIIIFNLKLLFESFKEIEEQINYKLFYTQNIKDLERIQRNLKNHLLIAPKKIKSLPNELIVQEFPIRIFQLIEKINATSLKYKYNVNSDLKIKDYILDLNSRVLIKKDLKLNLTERECELICYLSKSNKDININELQSAIWGYNIELETHTVETHIYRIRKKIFNIFRDSNFIIRGKNGYNISL